MTKLVRVKIPAVWFGGTAPADFKLGLGPCGKVVTSLAIDYDANFVILEQVHADNTYKIFRYRICDLVGRIEEEYE